MTQQPLVDTSRRPLKVGLLLPCWTRGMGGKTPGWSDILAFAQHAEAVGFDSLWVADNLVLRFETGEVVELAECWSVLAALAATTTRATIGTLVTCTGFRNPALLAKMALTVDEISGGRLILGIGAGGVKEEHQLFGFPWEQRYSRFEEAVTILHQLLRTGYADFTGEYYQVRECCVSVPRKARPNGPPLLIGTGIPGPRMLRLTARYADLWNGWLTYDPKPPYTLAELQTALSDACQSIQRDPATLERTICVPVSLDGHRLICGAWDFTDGGFSGPPEELADALRVFARQGISHLQLCLAPSTLEGLDAFAPVLALLDQA